VENRLIIIRWVISKNLYLARRGGAYCPPDGKTSFVPVVVWELSEAEVKLLKEAKK
jgi:hypothetical protein